MMINDPIGIRALALSFPSLIRTNDYWKNKLPNLISDNKPRRVKLSEYTDNTEQTIWSQAVAPYLPDPFRGSIERRVLAANESSLTLEYQAAKNVLDAAQVSAEEVELVIVTSLFPEQIGLGNATYLAHQLNLHCPAWNLESTCSSALIALQNARALIQTGEYRNVLVVVSHIGSNVVDENDTLSWSMGDGAGAFIVDLLKPNQGIIGTKIVNTAATCGAYSHELVTDTEGKPQMRTRTGKNASMLAETAVDFVRTCCQGAVAAAGITLDQINFFAFNTPTAWYASVCARTLGINPEHTINLYPRYANIGPVFPLANLYHAVQAGKIRENDLVLVYSNGAAATAAAMVMRWGDVALGSVPAPPIRVTQEEEKIHLVGKDYLLGEASIAVQNSDLSREKILNAEPDKRLELIENYLLDYLVNSLQLTSDQINFQQSISSFLDSLAVLVLRSRIETDFQVQVPMDRLLGDTTIGQVAEFIVNQLVLTTLISSELVGISDSSKGEEREKLSF